NEELETINTEVRERSVELDQVNAFLESIVGSLDFGIVVLNQQFGIRIWNHNVEEMWGLRADEVIGDHFLGLDIGLPVEAIAQPIRDCLTGTAEHQVIVLEAVNRRGRQVRCEVAISPLLGTNGTQGVILRMQTTPSTATQDNT